MAHDVGARSAPKVDEIALVFESKFGTYSVLQYELLKDNGCGWKPSRWKRCFLNQMDPCPMEPLREGNSTARLRTTPPVPHQGISTLLGFRQVKAVEGMRALIGYANSHLLPNDRKPSDFRVLRYHIPQRLKTRFQAYFT
ncbi:hypothetical protein BDK51DRAFT_31440 [Blyttiomyces helicus]|uniref:Uncharacterized protein n=1 Tax=Blyttiomyces helicus TaxID=388810 RepID=A0A4V1IPK8_9FUNG|nr:hypothetical protein BDK51DRAFT_31440 [Blyttiomyces helicus]|eukprot:RKO83407.1 hypothetical protein BDK51DRAFT_31440 [Blyttiomyces helicus]